MLAGLRVGTHFGMPCQPWFLINEALDKPFLRIRFVLVVSGMVI